MEKEAQKWEAEEVEEEEEATLQVRSSRIEKNDSKITENSTIIPGGNEKLISGSKGQAIQSTLTAHGAHKEESTFGNDEKIEKPDGILENEAENLVFFDKVEGVGDGKMEMLSESCKASEEIESAEIDLTNEEMEYDVETVLQKQDTHDLYCPNCSSCITRKVILRKRKRTKKVKRNKTESPSIQASDDHVHLHHHIGAEEDVDHDSGPDLFRCLSCFSFFIPTGNGFKLFRIFGDKSRKENVRDEHVPPCRKKNWFTSIFASQHQDTVIEQDVPRASKPLLGTVENDDAWCQDKILLSPRHEQSTNGLEVIYVSGNGPQKITEKIDDKMEQHEVVAGYHLKEPIISKGHFEVVAGYHLKEPIRSKEQVVEIVAGYHLKEPIISKDIQVTLGSDQLVKTLADNTEIVGGESAQDAIFFSRKGGANLVISNDESTTITKSEEGQIFIQTTQKGSQGM